MAPQQASALEVGNNGYHSIAVEDAIELLEVGSFQRRVLCVAGLCSGAESMEVLLLAFLAIVLQVEWKLTNEQASSITSVMFLGSLLGTLVLGPLGDRIGRKPVFTITAAIIAIFGLATAMADSYRTLLFCRFMVGFGYGGSTVPFDTLSEFLPAKHRGAYLVTPSYCWAAGSLLVPFLAYLTLRQGSWRIFVLCCAVPSLLATLLTVFLVPESPLWLNKKGKNEKALKVLRHAAAVNGKDPHQLFPPELLLERRDGANTGKKQGLQILVSPKWRNLTLRLASLWLMFAFLYYGILMAVTFVFSTTSNGSNSGEHAAAEYDFDYQAIIISGSAEALGTTLLFLTIERLGRTICQSLSYFLLGLAILPLCILSSTDRDDDTSSLRNVLVILAVLSHMFAMAGCITTWVITAELLPTEIRMTGHSAFNALARIGAAISPFIVSKGTPIETIGVVLLLVSVCSSGLSWQLPETQGKAIGTAVDGLDEPVEYDRLNRDGNHLDGRVVEMNSPAACHL